MEPMELVAADDGRAVETAAGSRFSILLEENPTTGYRWAVEGLDEGVAVLRDSVYALGEGKGIGGGGARRMVFDAVRPGVTEVRLKLWREWAGEASVRQRYSVLLTVGEAVTE